MENLDDKDYPGGNKIMMISILLIIIVLVGGVLFFIFHNTQNSEQIKKPLKQQDNLNSSVNANTLDIDDVCSISREPMIVVYCYINAAFEQRNIDICKKISNDPEGAFKEECEDMINEKMAHEKKDASFCLKSTNLRECVEDVVELTGDKSVCKYWPEGLVIRTCEERAKIQQAIIAKDVNICNTIEFYQTKSKCYGELGVIKNDPALCDLAGTFDTSHSYDQDKRECYRKLAMLNVNQEYCQHVSAESKEDCIEDVNTIKENFKQCVSVKGKNACLSVVSEIIDDIEDCRTVNDETPYYIVATKNCYSQALTKCKEMSSRALQNECSAFVHKKYNHELELNEELVFYKKQLALSDNLEHINITYDLKKNIGREVKSIEMNDDEKNNSTQQKKEVTMLKSKISSTVPAVIMCMNNNGYIMKPKDGGEICRGNSSDVWPIINTEGGKWNDGCEMKVNRVDGNIRGFEYCASLLDGSIAHCNERGCKFE